MKYLLLCLLFFSPLVSYAETPMDNITQFIAETAKEYGINPQLALYVSYKESKWNPSAIGDHGTSFGLWQIHNPTKKKIRPLSIQEAKDYKISTRWAMQTMIEDGDCHQWSTCPDDT